MRKDINLFRRATQLLHLLETTKPKYATILYSIIKYTQRSKFYDSIQQLYIDHADDLLEEMKADATQKRKFYALFAEILHESKSYTSYYDMVQKYLHSFKKEDKDFSSETVLQFLIFFVSWFFYFVDITIFETTLFKFVARTFSIFI